MSPLCYLADASALLHLLLLPPPQLYRRRRCLCRRCCVCLSRYRHSHRSTSVVSCFRRTHCIRYICRVAILPPFHYRLLSAGPLSLQPPAAAAPTPTLLPACHHIDHVHAPHRGHEELECVGCAGPPPDRSLSFATNEEDSANLADSLTAPTP